MSNASTPSFPDFGKLVPGFDFLQNLVKQAAGSATQATPQLPNLANWIAPTLNVEELDKRVQELKAVQFWLDQNAAALKATIQALEVQRMTLATLQGMNFNMSEMGNAFKVKVSDSMAGGMQRMSDMGKSFPGLEIPPSTFQANKARAESESAAKPSQSKSETGEAPAATGVVDPMHWWGALTQQFQTIAADAMKEVAKVSSLDTTKNIATGIAQDAVKTATEMATGMAKGMAESATKTMAGGARAASSWSKPDAPKASSTGASNPAASRTAASKAAATQSVAKPAAKSKPKAPAARRTAGSAARKTTR